MREFALLSDGREVTLLEDRGWTTSAPLGGISVTHVVRNVYTVVLPDNAEETGEEHEWQRFEQRLREAGVAGYSGRAPGVAVPRHLERPLWKCPMASGGEAIATHGLTDRRR